MGMNDFNDQMIRTIRVVLTGLGQTQAQAASGAGMSVSSFNRKMVGKSKWTVEDVAQLAHFWGCAPFVLLQTADVALGLIIGKAPRQRTTSAAA